ncbi:MAG: hypothetical protein HY000_16500 [Planctomycetes bacterium]|nr:hypothetical protein [Planctomycetota bacterium]
MPSRPLAEWTLRELCTAADKDLRELATHCEGDLSRAFGELGQRLRAGSHGVTPAALRAAGERIRDSHAFAEGVYHRLVEMLTAISEKVRQDLERPSSGEIPMPSGRPP